MIQSRFNLSSMLTRTKIYRYQFPKNDSLYEKLDFSNIFKSVASIDSKSTLHFKLSSFSIMSSSEWENGKFVSSVTSANITVTVLGFETSVFKLGASDDDDDVDVDDANDDDNDARDVEDTGPRDFLG